MKPTWWMDGVLADTTLRADERLLLLWLGRRPSGWRYSVTEAMRVTGFGKDRYQRALSTLKAAGHVVTSHKRDRRGHIKYTILAVRNTPAPEAGKSGLRTGSRVLLPSDRKPDFKARSSSTDKGKKSPNLRLV